MHDQLEPHDLDDAGLRDRAVAAARGLAPFDVLLTGGRVIDMAFLKTYVERFLIKLNLSSLKTIN